MVESLYKILQTNPNRFLSVPPIVMKTHSDTQENEPTPATLCGWIPTPLEPPGPLAAILWKTNPEFRAGTPPVRRSILRDAIVALQTRVENELRGRQWQRKKINEQLSAQQTADASPPQDTKELDAALAHFYQIQIVFVDEANKKIKWVPEDLRTWSSSLPVWGLSVGSRAIYHNVNETSVGSNLSQWLSDRENEGWHTDYMEAEGTLESIKATMSELNVGVGSRIEKPKKADYAAALGRAQTIRHLHAHFSGPMSESLEPMLN
jgi:hypothetical protein